MQTEIEKLPQLVEAILFVAGDGVEIKDIAEKLEVDVKQVKEAIEKLKEKHADNGINIITYKNSVQMCSNSVFAEDISVVLNPIREKQLTNAALETLAIIAYKQPITKLEIEQVRNVKSCDYAMQVLSDFKLIEVVGRKDAVGKPLLYGTTEEFLKHFNLQDIDSLPDYDEILERIEIIHAQDAKKGDSLYGSTVIIPEDQLADSVANKNNEQKSQPDSSVQGTEKEENLGNDVEAQEPSSDQQVDNAKEEKETKQKELKEDLVKDNSNDIIDNFKDSDIL